MRRLSGWTFWLVATSVAACTTVHLPGDLVIVETEPDARSSSLGEAGSVLVPRPDAAAVDAEAPSPPAGLSIDLVDLDSTRGTVTGSVTVHHATDEHTIVGYEVRWADSKGKALPSISTLFSWVANGEDFAFDLDAEPLPAGGARLSVVPLRLSGAGAGATSRLVDAFTSPLTEKFVGTVTFARDADGSNGRLVIDGAVRDPQVLENGSPGAVTCDELGRGCTRALLAPVYWRTPFVSLAEDPARGKTLRPFFTATGAHWLECLRDGTSSCSLVDVTGGFGAGSDSEVARAAVDPARSRVFLAQRGGASLVATNGTTLSTVPGYGVTEPEISNAVIALDAHHGQVLRRRCSHHRADLRDRAVRLRRKRLRLRPTRHDDRLARQHHTTPARSGLPHGGFDFACTPHGCVLHEQHGPHQCEGPRGHLLAGRRHVHVREGKCARPLLFLRNHWRDRRPTPCEALARTRRAFGLQQPQRERGFALRARRVLVHPRARFCLGAGNPIDGPPRYLDRRARRPRALRGARPRRKDLASHAKAAMSPHIVRTLGVRALGAMALVASIATACMPDPVRDADVVVYVQKEAGASTGSSPPARAPEAGIDAEGPATVDASREASTDASPDAPIDASSRTTLRLSGTADLRWTERSVVPATGCPTDRPEMPYRATTCCTKSYALSDTAATAVQVTVEPAANTVTVGAVPLVYGPKSYWQGVMSWASSAHCTQILRTVASVSQAPEAPQARAFVGAVTLRCPVAEWNEDEAAYAPYLGTAFVSASYRDLVETSAVDGCESTAKVTLQLGLRP